MKLLSTAIISLLFAGSVFAGCPSKTINGKVVDLEHFRHRMMIEHELDDKYAEREKEVGKWKKWGLILFVGLLYPIYLTVMNHAGIGKVLENLMKL